MDNTFYQLYSQTSGLSQTDTLFGNFDTTQLHQRKIVQKRKSMFTGKEPLKHTAYLKRPSPGFDLAFYVLSAEIILLIIVLALNRKLLIGTLGGLFSNKMYQQRERKNVVTDLRILPLFGLFVINLALFADVHFATMLGPLNQWGAGDMLINLMLLIAGFYLVKIVLVYLSAWIFNVPQTGQIYNDFIYISLINYGLFLSFFLWFDLFTSSAQWAIFAIVVFGLIATLRIVRTYSAIIPKSGFSVFHFFLYLCTVEILPLIVLVRLVEQGIK